MSGARSALRILVVNAGSSSLKLRVIEADDRVSATADLPARGGHVEDSAIETTLRGFGKVDAAGHRVVHGGNQFSEAVRIDERVEQQLHALADLAPLHQPAALAVLAAVRRVLPQVPAVACFDTAFHAAMPVAATTYALPAEWRSRWKLRRYGFHGLSHAYASRRAAELLGPSPDGLRVVTCHLGAGASLAAVADGLSRDTTMGFTPLEGLVMATRSGSVDPGLVLWLQEHVGMPARELAETLEHRSGLLGLAGTAEMDKIIDRAGRGDRDAVLALDVYVHRLRAGIAAMAAAMNGLDALVFTGGVGEHAPAIRARAAEGLGFLGVRLDEKRNVSAGGDREISGNEAAVRSFVIEAREDLEIARQVRGVMETRA